MSADDDDDFWANEDFIATIENVVKKAEEASAARHGGTQSVASTPHCSAILPPGKFDGRIRGAAGPSTRGTPHVPEFPSSRPSDALTAPVPREVDSATISRHGEDAAADCRGTLLIGTPLYLGQHQVSLRSMNYQVLAEEVREDLHNAHQSLQEVSMSVLPKGGADGVGEDSGRYGQLMAEKDRTISVLRSRVQEAEEHLDDLLKRVGSQSAPQPCFYQQQLELERLSAQLLFKDHEIIEVQRAHAEKEEGLKDALAETVALKEELDKLKKSRQTSPAFKQPWNGGDMDVFEKKVDCYGNAMNFPCESPSATHGVSKLNRHPCMPERISEAGRNTNTGLLSSFPQDAGEGGDFLTPNEVSPIIESPKVRTGGNGPVSLDGKESTKIDKLQANECHERDMLRRAGSSMPGRSDGEGLPFIEQLNRISRKSEMCYSLRHLWGIKGVTNDCASLLSKLYTSCGQDLFVLTSNGESQVVKSLRSTDIRKEGQIEIGTISEKLQTALGKVTNGLARPGIIITPLLEFCKLENVNLVGSALHILRYILHHDSTCRRNLLFRGSQHGVDCQVQTFSSCETLEKHEKVAEDKGSYIKGASKGSDLKMSHRAMFSSPRILFHPQAGDDFVQYTHGRRGLAENDPDKGGQEPHRASDQLQLPVWEHEEAGFEETLVHAEDLNLLVKWMLHLALTTTSPNVKFEAIANIGVVVMNSEPLVERPMFGSLLCHGAMDLLLKESLRSEIQLQAVRIVYLLLKCPIIIQRFCVEDEDDERTILQSKFVNEGNARLSPHLENQSGKSPVNSHDEGLSSGQTLETSKMAVCSAPQQLYYTALSKAKLLDGLTVCLKYTDNSPQGYALHRSVIRLLAFIVSFGDSGAAALMQAGASCEDSELGKTFQDNSKMERVVGAESASGQTMVGDGSGLTHLKFLDLGYKGNGAPTSLVDESVDDSGRAPNIPQRLLALLDSELDIEEREEPNEPSIAEERDHLIREAVTLLCRLTSDRVQSPVVIGHLISNKDRIRLTLSVTNRLLSRKTDFKQSCAGQKPAAPNADVAELALGLRRRIMRCLEGTSPSSF